jgi:hypothetical protein
MVLHKAETVQVSGGEAECLHVLSFSCSCLLCFSENITKLKFIYIFFFLLSHELYE